jgi:periplasmic protein TonB
MELKKNPEFDLNRNSGLYFEIGLALMLFVSYSLLNYKTYDKQDVTLDMITINEDLEEDIPLINVVTPPPPPPPKAAPEVITVVEDVVEVEETVIESTETSMEEAIEERIVSVEDVNVDEVEEDISVPFAVVEKVPIWPGCKGKTNAELKKCFQENMIAHVKKNFEYPQTAIELGIRGKVFVLFTIDSNGNVANIKTRGPDRILEREAERIVSLLPQMIPGKQRGRSVNVPYSLPIVFKYLENKP